MECTFSHEVLMQKALDAWLYDWGMHIALAFVNELRPVAGVRDVLEGLRPREDDAAPSTTRDNAARVRAAYEAFAAGDGRALVELLSDEVVYHLPGNHLGGGTLRGRAALFGRLAGAASLLDERPTIRIGAVVGFGEWVLSTERFHARRGGLILDQEVCVAWRMREGRCAEMWARFADQASCDRFWR